LDLEAKIQKVSKAFNEEHNLMKKLLYVCEADSGVIMEDLAAVAERREEPRVNHEQFLAELRKDGILHDHLA
jgi:DNA-binding IscR family transcriptional regulator